MLSVYYTSRSMLRGRAQRREIAHLAAKNGRIGTSCIGSLTYRYDAAARFVFVGNLLDEARRRARHPNG